MSNLATYTLGLTVVVDDPTFGEFVDRLARKTARAELLPIMKKHMAPVVAFEKGLLVSHTKSGALSKSLKARAGGGDRPGTMSVFIAPYSTNKGLAKTWGKGRPQQQRWARKKGTPGRGRRSVFYGPFVERGHRVVKRNQAGELYDTGKTTKPVRFAAQTVPTLEHEVEAGTQAIIKHIVEGM